MTATTVRFGGGCSFTVHDLDKMPDDGRRYELIDGALCVSPAPDRSHEEASGELLVRLRAACPPDLRVIAPFAVRPDAFTELHLDLLVTGYGDLTSGHRSPAPLLAVEVTLPGGRAEDATLKRAVYARLGVASYWLVDPNVEAPSVTAWELVGPGEYRRVAHAVADQPFEPMRPFPVRFTPTDLIARQP